MVIHTQFSLLSYNTFGVKARADKAVFAKSDADLQEIIQWPEVVNKQFYILGGGSNVLFTNDFHGLIVFPELRGINILDETAKTIRVEVGAGENWDEWVAYAVNQGWGGIENLSLIPGNVGACPIQNIGAYGTEAKETVQEVRVLNIETGKKQVFKTDACQFGYRSSLFKSRLKGKVIICSVVFVLSKSPQFKLNYGTLKQEVEKLGDVSLQTIREAVIRIRNSKLPDPNQIGNGGSFFKNPEIDVELYDVLKNTWTDMPGYTVTGKKIKIPAAFLIEKTGWKGFRRGVAGVHQTQPLVLVNFGDASGKEIHTLGLEIQQSVKEKFNIVLELEVNIIS